jgi:multiple sugar transport system substrate-binding protein
MKKLNRMTVSVWLIALALASCSQKKQGTSIASSNDELKGKLVTWSWTDNFSAGLNKEFTRLHPQVSFEFIPIQNADMIVKIQQTLASGGDMPDIITYDSNWWKRANDMDLNIHLNDYGFNINDYMDYVHSGMLDKNGNIQGIDYQVNVGAFAVKDEMAQKYLGTTNRDELLAMFVTTDKMIETGQKVLRETNGKIKMFGAVNFFQFWFNYGTGGACVNNNGEFELTKNHLPVYQNLIRFWRSGIIDNNQAGTPAYIGMMTDDVHIGLMTCMADIFYTFMPNDPDGKVKMTLLPLPSDANGYQLGGTSFGIPKTSKNILVAVEYLRYFFKDLEGVKYVRDALGGFVPLKAAYDDPTTLGPYTYKNFGDFDYGAFYMDIAKKVRAIPYSEYDQVVRTAMNTAEAEIWVNNSITPEQCLDIEIKEILARMPEAKIK